MAHRYRPLWHGETETPAWARALSEEVWELHEQVRTLHHLLTEFPSLIGAQLTMALNPQAQAIVDAINAGTNDIAAAIKTGVQAITNLAAKVTAGTIDPAELTAAIQPSLDTMKAAAAALTKTATDADPAINAAAAALVVPPAVPDAPPAV